MSQPTALGGELSRATYTVPTGTGSPDVQVTSRGSEPRRSPILQIGRLSFLGHPRHGTHVPGGFDPPCFCSSLSLCRDGLPSPPPPLCKLLLSLPGPMGRLWREAFSSPCPVTDHPLSLVTRQLSQPSRGGPANYWMPACLPLCPVSSLQTSTTNGSSLILQFVHGLAQWSDRGQY